MPDFRNRFINLADQLGLAGGVPVPESDHGLALRNAVLRLTDRSDGTGGIIYLQPGRWLFGGADTIVIPPKVTLVVAPGAVIVPLNPAGTPSTRGGVEVLARPALEIQGALDAGPQMFISTPAFERYRESLAGPDSPPGAALDVGWLSFPSDDVAVIHPEWWGAGSVRETALVPSTWSGLGFIEGLIAPLVDTAALEAALRSALFRTPWNDLRRLGIDGLLDRPLPIEILTHLRLHRSLIVGQREWALRLGPDERGVDRWSVTIPSVAGLVLRGRRGPTRPHLTGFTLEPQVALLIADRTDGLRIEDLWFDPGFGFPSGLVVLFAPKDHPTRVDVVDCTISGGPEAWLVSTLTARPVVPSTDTARRNEVFRTGVWAGELYGDRLSFVGCRFVCSSPPSVCTDVALMLDAEGVRVDVDDSTFSGAARAMITILGGSLSVDNCRFANAYVADLSLGADPPIDARTGLPEVGIDVEVWGTLLAPVTLSLSACSSTSRQFLSMEVHSLYDVPSGQKLDGVDLGMMGSACQAVVTNLQHQPAAPDPLARLAGDASVLPPAIYWGSNPPRLFPLTMIGGRLLPMPEIDAVRAQEANKVAVQVGGDQAIYDAWLLPPGPRYVVWASLDAPCNVVTLAPRVPG